MESCWGFSEMTIATAGVLRRAQGVSAFSFDVFDTFLVRACTTPEGVFERTYELSGISETHPHVSESFVQHRIQAEARAQDRQRAVRIGGSSYRRYLFLFSTSAVRPYTRP